jgi:hypothetical protein
MLPRPKGWPKREIPKRKSPATLNLDLLHLDPNAGLAPVITQDAIQAGLSNPQVYVANDSFYVLTLNGKYEFSSSLAEAIWCHIDILRFMGEENV